MLEADLMAQKTEDILAKALQSPRTSRSFLAEKLLASLDYDEPFEVSPAWFSEARRRAREIDAGTAEMISAEKVFEEVRKGTK